MQFVWWTAGIITILLFLEEEPKIGALLLLVIVLGALAIGQQKNTI